MSAMPLEQLRGDLLSDPHSSVFQHDKEFAEAPCVCLPAIVTVGTNQGKARYFTVNAYQIRISSLFIPIVVDVRIAVISVFVDIVIAIG